MIRYALEYCRVMQGVSIDAMWVWGVGSYLEIENLPKQMATTKLLLLKHCKTGLRGRNTFSNKYNNGLVEGRGLKKKKRWFTHREPAGVSLVTNISHIFSSLHFI